MVIGGGLTRMVLGMRAGILLFSLPHLKCPVTVPGMWQVLSEGLLKRKRSGVFLESRRDCKQTLLSPPWSTRDPDEGDAVRL